MDFPDLVLNKISQGSGKGLDEFEKLKANPEEKLKIEKLDEQYGCFYSPAFELKVEEIDLLRQGVEVTNITVKNSLNSAGQFSFTVTNAYDFVRKDFNWLEDLFVPGKIVSIKLGYAGLLKPMMLGRITSVKVTFPSGGAPQIEIGGMDFLEPLMKNKKQKSWSNVKHSEVVKKIISETFKDKNKLEEVIDETAEKFPIVMKNEQSDFEFINNLAKENHFEFFITGKTVYFRKQPENLDSVIILEWGRNLVSFSTELNVSKQVGCVKVIGWDPINKKAIIGKADKVTQTVKDNGTKTGSDLAKEIHGDNSVICVHCRVTSKKDADKKAQAILDEHASKLVTGNAESLGIPELIAGRYISLNSLGKKFSKQYYIVSSNHTISSSGYRTTFDVEVNTI
ncbi:MAG TPA: hypothetical protein VHT34_04045 [Clostridia bacterium]|nr:hypothetical protein [Clostridia bacterium]